ncbi:C40 family peptidase [Terrisporobacter glycolicus]|uniref:SH3 domain protein n=1 Tax=Terrisporobacter glycolicus ATCC 14880 = DSM 1288 TaxID=1121315 RepID=A0ABZ2EW77_9FIRM|nr:C40 family peptidase [Terrisporobacter glycolicus]
MIRGTKVMTGLTIMGTVISISSVYADNQEGIVNTSVLNIRNGPSTSYTIITQVKLGNKLQILGKKDGWYKVKLSNGTTGYGSSQYININENNASSDNSINMEGKKGQIKVNGSLNVRKGPSTDYAVVAKLRNNEIVNLLEKSNGWYKVKLSNGIIGWTSGDYISIYTGSTSNPESSTNVQKVQSIVKMAHEQLGKPYVWGAEGPNSFDCSGLVHYIFGKHKIQTPRVSRDQYKIGKTVSKSNLQPGDLIFSSTASDGQVTHVGIYVGNGQMIHAPNSKSVVKKVDINNSYWKSVYVGAKRIL